MSTLISRPSYSEVYRPKEFNKNEQLLSMYGTKASLRDKRRFNRYWNSEQRQKDEAQHYQDELIKSQKSWDDFKTRYQEYLAQPKSEKPTLAPKPEVKQPQAVPQSVSQSVSVQVSPYWENVAKTKGFNSAQEVAEWQKANGLVADGKFGPKSQAKWDSLMPTVSKYGFANPLMYSATAKLYNSSDWDQVLSRLEWAHSNGYGDDILLDDNGLLHVQQSHMANPLYLHQTSDADFKSVFSPQPVSQPVSQPVAEEVIDPEEKRRKEFETLGHHYDWTREFESKYGIKYPLGPWQALEYQNREKFLKRYYPNAVTTGDGLGLGWTVKTEYKPGKYYVWDKNPYNLITIKDLDKYWGFKKPVKGPGKINIDGVEYDVREYDEAISPIKLNKLWSGDWIVYNSKYGTWERVDNTENGFRLTGTREPVYKQGGKMNKINYFQNGGAVPQQDVKQQVIALVQAAMQGDQKATEAVNNIMEAAKAGDPKATQLAQMITEVAKQMQKQAVTAKWGSKLDYIRELKNPKKEKTCKDCDKKVEMKACGGKKAKKRYFGGLI